MIEQGERAAMLVALGVEKDPRDALDDPLQVKSWPLPRAAARPVKPREPGVPEWWDGDAEASDTFLAALGVHL